MNTAEQLSCPFCDFADADADFLAQHVELCHPENGTSPFLEAEEETHIGTTRKPEWWHGDTPLYTDEDAETDIKYVDCPTGCGEAVTEDQLMSHLDLHLAEGLALEEPKGFDTRGTNMRSSGGIEEDEEISPTLSKALGKHDGKRQRDAPIYAKAPKQKKKMRKAGQLGTTELGPYAREPKMPSWLHKMLKDGPDITRENRISPDGTLHKVEIVSNETPGLIPVIARLCQQDYSVEQAYLCSPNVRHIFKMQKEGGFCGYRNIQMLVSYIQGNNATGHEHFPGRTPSILKLQDMIEQAWDNGFNSHGRTETGGIRGTRKYIGTPEAAALFQNSGIPCRPKVCSETTDDKAFESLYLTVAEYFLNGKTPGSGKQIVQTDLPPIYLQHAGHSMTIVGFEIRENRSVNLLVFDPMFKTSPATSKLVGTQFNTEKPDSYLKAFRRTSRYLRQFDTFELLMLEPLTEKSTSEIE
ncbi:hypothetical protein MGYG_04129 [Nannizzia gypsea CBS 118893]|uniref:UFSP1/2/DUB catalytic domain-containing protein n=1 Tax=Arthroderma gypseum (strain ATCC MYA-4604 / CBS 118893) TaxID=535722 RepID=E4UV08_ARTGP|nr:hypothetical protein MGYG_04129 [Nannizzia gypsea CBS 118893]EFR01125.1 hypothetical protein MGYG_04129 [Nannizzia gypsea CBS 118893]